jgi:small subunit ribosomal protein S16
VPFYHIVAADSRTPRDGKFLEKVGSYNPISNPAEISVDHDLAIKWLKNGAQPTKTVRSILRYSGVTMRYALIVQGKSQEDIDRIYGKWEEDKKAKIDGKKTRLKTAAEKAKEVALAHEGTVREKRAAAILAKNTPPPAAPAAEAPEVEAEAPATEE